MLAVFFLATIGQKPCSYPTQFAAEVHTYLYGSNTLARKEVYYSHYTHCGSSKKLKLMRITLSYSNSKADKLCTTHRTNAFSHKKPTIPLADLLTTAKLDFKS